MVSEFGTMVLACWLIDGKTISYMYLRDKLHPVQDWSCIPFLQKLEYGRSGRSCWGFQLACRPLLLMLAGRSSVSVASTSLSPEDSAVLSIRPGFSFSMLRASVALDTLGQVARPTPFSAFLPQQDGFLHPQSSSHHIHQLLDSWDDRSNFAKASETM